MTMTPQEVIKAFMASLANHGYSYSSSVGNDMLDAAIRASSRYSSASEAVTAMQADQVAAEKQAVEEVLGSGYVGQTLSDITDSSILSAEAKTHAGAKAVSNAFLYGYSPNAKVTVADVIKERKTYIFLEDYCGIKLPTRYWFTNGLIISYNDSVVSIPDGEQLNLTGNTDTGAITGSDAGGSTTEKTAESVVPETYANTYRATTSTAQTIITNSRNWVVQATDADDTITAKGADSINAGAGDDQITVNSSGATVTSGAGEDVITVNQTVNDITLSDLNSSDALTISGEFEIGSAHIEDTLLVVTDKTGTRKIRLGDFENAKNASVNVNGSASTTIAQWLSKANIVYSSLADESYAAQVLGNTSEGNVSGDGRISLDNYTPPAFEETAVQQPKLTAPFVSSNSNEGDGSITVDLDTVDASAAGDVTVNGQVVGAVSSEFPNASTFTRNGLTVHLLGESSSSSPDNIIAKTLDELTDDQRTIVASLFKWWAAECLTINEESYGISFNSPTAMLKDIGLFFYTDQNSGTLASVWNWQRVYTDNTGDGALYKLMLNVNMKYYSGISEDDVNGTSTATGAGYLDRTLAHEFTHAVMASNVNFFNTLPQFIKEGIAELTHGIDDERGYRIFNIAYNGSQLEAALSLNNTSTGESDAYAGGYMFFRYLAKQAAASQLPAFGEITATVNVSDEGIYYITGTTANETAQVAASEADVPDGAIKLGELKNGVYTVNDTGVHQIINNVNQVEGLTVNDTFNGTSGNDTVNTAQGSNVLTGDGDDSINVYGQYATINAGAGADTVNVLDGSHHSINTGDGSNFVSFALSRNYNNTVTGGAGNDTVSILSGEENLFDLGAGNDSIVFGTHSSTVLAGDGDDTVTIRYSNQENVVVELGGGSDIADIRGSEHSVTGGADNDSIQVIGHHNSVYSGTGDDTISVSYFGDDTSADLSLRGSNYLDAGEGDDAIRLSRGGQTIVGGAGDDLIYQYSNSNGGNVYLYDTEDFGDDVIQGFMANDQIVLGTGFGYSVSAKQDDYLGNYSLVTVTKGSATVGTIAVNTASDVTFDAETNIVTSHIEIDGLTYNKAGYYEIADAQDLVDLATYVNAGNTCEGMTFKQTKDIDMSSVENFTQIVYSAIIFISNDDNSYIDCYFAGTFDGQGNVISNLTITKGGYEDKAALFGINRGTIKNVKLLNANISAYSGVAGIAVNNCGTIENCFVDGKIHDTCGNNQFKAVVYNNDMMSDPTNPEVLPVEPKVENCYYHVDATDENATKVYAVTAPDGFTISDINGGIKVGNKFFAASGEVTATVAATDNHLVIDGESTFTATIDNADMTLDVKFHVKLTAGGESYTNNYSNVSVLGSAGNDIISNEGDNVTIDGGEGNDEIFNGVNGVLIDVSKGDDLINSGWVVTEFDVRGFGVGDTINLQGGTVNGGLNVVDGKLIATVDTKPVTIGGISAVSTNGKAWALDGNVAKYGDGKTAGAAISGGKIIFTNATVTDAKVQLGGISNLDGVNVNTFNEVNIHASVVGDNGASVVSNTGNYAFYLHDNWDGKTFTGTDTVDNIILDGSAKNVSVNAGAGDDTIVNNGSNVSIDGGADDDTIFLTGTTGNTINTAQGNDTIQIDTDNDVNDFTVENFNVGDAIQFIGYESNPDWTSDMPEDQQQIQVAFNIDSLTEVDGKLVATAGDKTVTINGLDLSQGDGWSLDGNTATYFTGTTAGAYINGDRISFRKADKRGEQVQLGGISNLDGLEIYASNYVKISASAVGDNGASIVSNEGNYNFTLLNDWKGKTFTGSDATNFINIDGSAKNISVDGGAGSDVIINDGTNVTIDGGDGSDNIVNKGSNVSIDAGDGSDNISNTASDVAINGGAGNDDISNSGAKVTIDGGAGSNTINLTGSNGTGNDVDDIVIKAGTGANTIKVGANMKKFSVNGFGRNDVIELNQLLTADSFNINQEGNLVAGDVTVGGMGTFDQGGDFSATDDGSIVYTNGTDSVTVAQTTIADNVTSLVYRKDGSELSYTFNLTGLVVNAIDGDNNTKGITAENTLTVEYDNNKYSAVGGYIITIDNGGNGDDPENPETESKYAFAKKSGDDDDTVCLVKLNEEGGTYSLPDNYTKLDNAIIAAETTGGGATSTVTVALADALLPTSGSISIDTGDTYTYSLALAEASTKAFTWSANWSKTSADNDDTTTYTTKLTSTGGWYSESDAKLTYKAAVENGGDFTLTSKNFGATVTEATSLSSVVTFTHDGATIKQDLLGAADISITKPTDFSVEFGDDVSTIGNGNTIVPAGWEANDDSNGFVYSLDHASGGEAYELKTDATKTTITYYPKADDAKVVTLTGLGTNVVAEAIDPETKGQVVIGNENASISGDATGGYTVTLNDAILNAAATGLTAGTTTGSITAAAATDATYNVGITFVANSTVDTAKTANHDASLTPGTGAESSVHTYSSPTYDAWFELTKTENTKPNNDVVIVNASVDAKQFTIIGLDDEATTGVSFTDTNATAQYYMLKFDSSILSGEDVIVTNSDSSDSASIVGAIEGDYADDGKTSIGASVFVNSTDNIDPADKWNTITVQMAGYKAGYFTLADYHSYKNTDGSFAAGIHTPDTNAVLVYAKQRHGEILHISGLNDSVMSAFSAQDYTVPEAGQDGNVSLATGIVYNTTSGTITLSMSALDENILLNNTDIDPVDGTIEFETGTGNQPIYTKYTLALGSDVTNTVTAVEASDITVEAENPTDDDYKEAYDAALLSNLKTSNNGVYHAMAFDNADAAQDEVTDPQDAQEAKSATYTYTSQYNDAFYTKWLDYDSTNTDADALFNMSIMARESEVRYHYYAQSEILYKTQFNISGLAATGLTSTDIEDGSNETVNNQAKITINYEKNTDEDGNETYTGTVTINSKDALPTDYTDTDTDENAYDIGLAHEDGSIVEGFTLAFGTALTERTITTGEGEDATTQHNADYSMVDTINYTVTETKDNEGKGTGTYTITRHGTTGGYVQETVEVTDSETGETSTTVKYVYQAQNGCEQFTVTGLKSGLTETKLTEYMFVKGKDGVWTFTPSTDVIDLSAATDDNESTTVDPISLTYNGYVTRGDDEGNQTPYYDSLTTQYAIDNTDASSTKVAIDATQIGDSSGTPEGWEKVTNGSFVYKTASTAYSWTGGKETAQTTSLTYTSGQESETVITLSGLKTNAIVDQMPELTPYVTETDATTSTTTYVTLVQAEATTGEGESATTTTGWYKITDCDYDKDTGTYTVKTPADGETAPTEQTAEGYLFNLPAAVFTKSASMAVTATAGDSSTYQNVILQFDGITPESGSTARTINATFVEETDSETQQSVGTGKYKYTSSYTPEQYTSTATTDDDGTETTSYSYVAKAGLTTFTISGLASNIDSVTEIKTTDPDETTSYSGAVTVDYKTGKVVLTKDALPDSPADGNKIQISDYDSDTSNNLTLTFDTSLTTKLSKDIDFSVVEDETEKGTYTITFSGTTAGYEYSKSKGTYTYYEQTGGEQFEISGLKSGLADSELSTESKVRSLLTSKTATVTDDTTEETTTTTTWTFTPKDALIDSETTSATGYNGITFTYKGDDSTSTFVTIDGEGLTEAKAADEAWSYDSSKKVFTFKTASTAESWSAAESETPSTTATLSHTAVEGGINIITLSGLTANNISQMPEPVPCDASGVAYVKVGENYYATNDVTYNKESQTYTVNENAPVVTDFAGYLFNLAEDTFSTTPVTYTALTDSYKSGKYNSKSVLIGFNGLIPQTNDPEQKDAKLTQAEDAQDKTVYSYTSPTVDAYVKDVEGTQDGATVHTYTYQAASTGELTFTIKGLPESIEGATTDNGVSDIDQYFTYAKSNDGKYTITLAKGVANEEFFTTDEDKATFIELTDVKVSGETPSNGTVTLALPENSTTDGFITNAHNLAKDEDEQELKATFKRVETESSSDGQDGTGDGQDGTGDGQDGQDDGTATTTPKNATYIYKSNAYTGYLSVADGGQSITYNKSRGGENLFTVSGLVYGSDITDLLGSNTTTYAEVDDDKGTILLYNGALAKNADVVLEAVEGGKTTYDLQIFDQAAYNAGLAAAEDTENYKSTYEGRIVATTADSHAATLTFDSTEGKLTEGTFTTSYTPAYFTDDKNTSGTQTVRFHEAAGYPDVITITGLDTTAVTGNPTIVEGTDKDGNKTFTVKYNAKDFFVVTYIKGTTTTSDSYTVAPTDLALVESSEANAYKVSVTAAADSDGTVRQGEVGVKFTADKFTSPTAFAADVKSSYDRSNKTYTYTVNLSGTSAGYTVSEDGESLTYSAQVGGETFSISGLVSGLTVAYLDSEGKVTSEATTTTGEGDDAKTETNHFIGLMDSNKNVLVSFGDYDDYINRSESDGSKAISEYSTNKGKVRISEAAIGNVNAITFTPDKASGATFSFDGFVTKERVISGTNANAICTEVPQGTASFTETKDNGDGTSNYVYTAAHTPSYFTAGEAASETGAITYTYQKAKTDGVETFTINNLKSGLTFAKDVDIDPSGSSTKAVVITSPKAAVAADTASGTEAQEAKDGTVTLNTGAMPTSTEKKIITVDISNNSSNNNYTLGLNTAVNSDKYSLDTTIGTGVATFKAVTESSSGTGDSGSGDGGTQSGQGTEDPNETGASTTAKYTYTSPKYVAYYTADSDNNRIVYNPARGGDTFTIDGLKAGIEGTAAQTTSTGEDGTVTHAGELTFTNGELSISEDGTVIINREALPEEMSAGDKINFDNTDTNGVTFKLSFTGSDIRTAKDSKTTAASIEQDSTTTTTGEGENAETTTTYSGKVKYTSAITTHEYLAAAKTADDDYDATYTYNPQIGGYKFIISGLKTEQIANLSTNIKVTEPTYNPNGTLKTNGTVTLLAPALQDLETAATVSGGVTISITPETSDGNAKSISAGDYQLALNTDNATKALASSTSYGSLVLTNSKNPNDYTFTASGSTAGYVVNDPDTTTKANTITYEAQKGLNTFTIAGIKAGLAYTGNATTTAEAHFGAENTNGITIGEADGEGKVTVTLSENALAQKDITLTDGEGDSVTYSLALDSNIKQNETSATTDGSFTAVTNRGVATYTTTKIDDYYSSNGDNSYKFNASTGGATFTISGLKTTGLATEAGDAEVTNLNDSSVLSVAEIPNSETGKTDITVTIKDTGIFNAVKNNVIKFGATPSGYTLNFKADTGATSDNPPIATVATQNESTWNVTGGKASLTSGSKNAFYSVASPYEFTQINYVGTVAGSLGFILSGLASTAATNTEAGVKYAEGKVTISTAANSVADANKGLTISQNNGAYGVVLESGIKLNGMATADTITVDSKATSAAVYGLAGNDVIEVGAAASIDGGAGNDTIKVTAAGAYIDGGAGNDSIAINASTTAATINFSAGTDTVDYSSGLVIKGLDNGYTYSFSNNTKIDQESGSVEAGSGDLVLTSGANKLVIAGGAGRAVNFVDSSGSQTAVTFDEALGDMLTFSGKTAVTVNGAAQVKADRTGKKMLFYGSKLGPDQFAVNDAEDSIVLINASPYETSSDGETGLAITGTKQNNNITGTKYNDTIDPGTSTSLSSNTVAGGTGNDVFIYNDGKLTITDFKSVANDETDTLKLGKYTVTTTEDGEEKTSTLQHEITSTTISGNNIIFGLDDDKINKKTITLTNAFSKTVTSVQVAVTEEGTDEDPTVSNNTYYSDGHIVSADGTDVTLTSTYRPSNAKTGFVATADMTSIEANNTAAAVINASVNTNGVTVESKAAANTIIGGTSSDSFKAAASRAELFVYSSGSDTVDGFEATDRVSLVSASESNPASLVAGSIYDITDIDVTQKADGVTPAIQLTNSSGSLLLSGADPTKALNINGKNYYVAEDMFLDNLAARATGVTLTANAQTGFFNATETGSDDKAIYNANLRTIDASEVTAASFAITGNAAANSIVAGSGSDIVVDAGKGNDTIDVSGGGGSATVKAGGGVDVIFGGEEGNNNVYVFTANSAADKLTIKDFKQGDTVSIVGGQTTGRTPTDIEIGETKAAVDSKGNVVFTAYDTANKVIGTVTVETVGAATENNKVVGTKINLSYTKGNESTATTTNYIYATTGITTEDGHSITLPSTQKGTVKATYDSESKEGYYNIDATNATGVTHIHAVNKSGTIVGNAGHNSIIGGTAADSLFGAAGNDTLYGDINEKDSEQNSTPADTLTGGAGNDVFYFGGGSAIITDYSTTGTNGVDRIALAAGLELTDYSINDKALTLAYTYATDETGTLKIENGEDTNLTFLNLNQKGQVTLTSTAFYSTLGTYNANKTAITLSSDTASNTNFEAGTVTAGNLSSVDSSLVNKTGVTVTAKDVNSFLSNKGGSAAVNLIGGTKNDTLFAGSGNDTLQGNAGNDLLVAGGGSTSLIGGAGNDTFVGGTGKDTFDLTGNTNGAIDVIQNLEAGDAITLDGYTLADASFRAAASRIFDAEKKAYTTLASDSKQILTVKFTKTETTANNKTTTTTVTTALQNVNYKDSVSTVNFNGYNYTVGAGTIAKDTSVTLTSAYNVKNPYTVAENGTTTAIHAEAVKNVKIEGNSSTTSILGGAGNDSLKLAAEGTLTGGAGNDTLVAGASATVDAGAGNDIIIMSESGGSVSGGAGNDTFVYAGGALTIADFGVGANKISLSGDLTMANISGVTVTPDTEDNSKAATIEAEFGSGNTLTLNVTNKAAAVTFVDSTTPKGQAYTFVESGYAIGKSLTLLSGGSYDYETLTTYTSVTANAKNTTIQGNTGHNNITLNETGSVAGGVGNDVLTAGGESVTLTGEAGNDTFVIKETGATITDYSFVNNTTTNLGADIISVDSALGAFSKATYDTDHFTLEYTVAGADDQTTTSSIFVNEKTGDLKVTLVEGKTKVVRHFTTLGSYNNNDTAITLNSDVTTYSAANGVLSVNSAAVFVQSGGSISAENNTKPSFLTNYGNTEAGLSLTGGQSNDTIIAGDKGDTIDGGKGNDILISGGGSNVFTIGLDSDTGKNSITAGNDVIVGFDGAKDKLSLQDGVVLADASFKMNQAYQKYQDGKLVAGGKGTNLVLTFNYKDTGKVADVVTLQNVPLTKNGNASVATVTIDNQEYSFYTDGKIAQGDGITLTSGYTATTFTDTLGTEGAPKYSSINAAANTRAISITGGGEDSSVTIVGSAGNNLIKLNNDEAPGSRYAAEFTGGKGNDTFAYSGGKVTVTDYSTSGTLGADRITLSSDFAMTGTADNTLKSIEVVDNENGDDTIALTFGNNKNVLTLNVADKSKTTVTIADSTNATTKKGVAYTFASDGIYGIGKSATVIAAEGTFGSNAGVNGTTYNSVTGGAVTLDGSAATAPLRLTLTGQGSAVGGKSNDILVGTAGGTLEGGAGVDTFIIEGKGEYVITDYYTGADRISVSADVGPLSDVESINGGDDYKLTFGKGTDTTTLTLKNHKGNTPILLTTTEYTDANNTKTKATPATVYAANHAVYDRASLNSETVVYTNATKVSLTSEEADNDFGGLTTNSKGATIAAYAALNELTAYTANSAESTIYGNNRANTITLAEGGTVAGGLGNDTYIIKGGDVTITDFGIGSTNTSSKDASSLVPLATAITGEDYDATDPLTYAPGVDVLKVNGKILSVSLGTGISSTAAAKDEDEYPTFSVELAVDYDYNGKADGTIVLENIIRPQVMSEGPAVNRNASAVDLNALKIFDIEKSGTTAYTPLAWGTKGTGALAKLLGQPYEKDDTDTDTDTGNTGGGSSSGMTIDDLQNEMPVSGGVTDTSGTRSSSTFEDTTQTYTSGSNSTNRNRNGSSMF